VNRRVYFVAAVLVVISVAVLFVLPAFDVLPTAMRAWRAAKLLTMAMAAQILISLLAAIISASCDDLVSLWDYSFDLLDLTCTRLC
jgi:hypothetical protein